MRRYSLRPWLLVVLIAFALTGLILIPAPTRGDDLDEQQERAIKDAVKRIAPSVVKIETSGGTEVVGPAGRGPRGMIRRGVGPTTGLIVSADGYVISSAFNFANKPSTIRVEFPGMKERKVARVVATDQTRMLTLLKVADLPASTKLPVAVPAPKKEIEIGLTAIAVGRTLTETDTTPSVSVGIISAIDRIWGRALQTDAKVSPTNYGGPLIDLQGRVQGILVPASPQAEGETAGFEWYDSGIGFAIPLEDINVVLPRMMKGTEKEPVVLKKGFMGISWESTDMYEAVPKIGSVIPGTAAEKAGLKTGDIVKQIDGKAINNHAQVQHMLGKKYEGDAINVKVERDKKEVEFTKLVLGSAEAAYPQAYLGILPIRDDPEPGVEVRYVYPKSAAEAAKVQVGDRIMKIANPQAPMSAPLMPIMQGRDQLANMLALARPGQDLKIEVKRKEGGKTETLTVKLTEMADGVPAKMPEKSSAKKALTRPGTKPRDKGKGPVKGKDKEKEKEKEKPAMVETGFQKKTTEAGDGTYWIYVPDNYDPNHACAIAVWLHPVGKNKERDFEDFTNSWSNYCDDHNIILICPESDNPRGWTPGEGDLVVQAVRSVVSTYTVDQRRIIVHGMGVGGEMAFYLGFQTRSLIRGVATVGATLGSNPREKVFNQPLSFFLIIGQKDPLRPGVTETKEKLTKLKYQVIEREIPNMGHEYIDGRGGIPTLEELIRWVDSLDRM
jgi:S1-C subfamily serine protease